MTGWVRADQIVAVYAQNVDGPRIRGITPRENAESEVVVRVAQVSGMWSSYGEDSSGSLDQVNHRLYRTATHKEAYILARRVVEMLVLYADEPATLRIVEGEVKVQRIKPAPPAD
ncbi:hypothetical protein [Nocardia carnea]|uniref:hypothetical protein n=1 Tax=Nocardia carnea TaxID=37328 RepID=UPI002454D456|nr:hypothetical protein [Nocardia carnea]